MTQKKHNKPTDAELEILNVLWERGASTVRDVHGTLARKKRVGYTTVLKFMQIMTGKGLVKRDESKRPQVYVAAQSEETMQRQLTGDLLTRAFRGSTQRLVMQALSAKRISADELSAIRDLLDNYGGKRS